MRALHLALIGALLTPAAASAQNNAQQMLEMARKLRENVERLKDSLPAETRAQMIKQAEEIEEGVRDGAYGDPSAPAPRKEPSLSERLAAAHGGRLDWLAREAACAGYTPENYLTFRYSSATNDRDTHCRNAYGHWATYLRVTRDGGDREAAEQALFYYDAAARRAVELHGGK